MIHHFYSKPPIRTVVSHSLDSPKLTQLNHPKRTQSVRQAVSQSVSHAARRTNPLVLKSLIHPSIHSFTRSLNPSLSISTLSHQLLSPHFCHQVCCGSPWGGSIAVGAAGDHPPCLYFCSERLHGYMHCISSASALFSSPTISTPQISALSTIARTVTLAVPVQARKP